MGRSVNPVNMAIGLPRQQLQWAQSLDTTLNGDVDMGTATAKDSTGQYSEFNRGNGSGVLIRVGPSGGTDTKYVWTTTGSGIAINHGLGRQPIGAHLVSSSKQLTIWQPQVGDENNINIAPSDATAYATLYIF
jgi:hypothetical protein